MSIGTSNQTTSTISRELVPEQRRATFVDALFGLKFPLQLEPCAYTPTVACRSSQPSLPRRRTRGITICCANWRWTIRKLQRSSGRRTEVDGRGRLAGSI